MSFLRLLFKKRTPSDASSPRAQRMLEQAKSAAVFTPVSPAENRYEEVKDETSVTGIYETVKDAMKDAVLEKKKATAAAVRVSNAIGTAGPDKPKT